ncbi:unnamed protein product [Pedinophyceae sp. YPF-701]|nr:unnamed protein product [Pedinophyceae sp. YPF-701]
MGPLALVLALMVPHVFYAWLWHFPLPFYAVFKDRSVDVFAYIAGVMKLVQFAAVGSWYITTDAPAKLSFTSLSPWLEVHPLQYLLFGGLVFVGQSLNTGIYKAIGLPGVYYGCKLGRSIPWHTGFPFSVCPHPQYVGSVATVWGLAALAFYHAPPGIGALALYWTALYAGTGLVEQYL